MKPLTYAQTYEENKLMRLISSSTNNSLLELLQAELTELDKINRLRPLELISLIVINATLMLFGATGALITIAAVIRKPRMRTPRTLLTVNLAVSDLILCLFTQPLNLIRAINAHYEWKFGEVMCKFTSFAQAINVFVATMSITVIALDRFNVIVHPFRSKRIWNRPYIVLPTLWLLALVMATPMLAFSTVTSIPTFISSIKERLICADAIPLDPSFQRFKYAYGIFTLIFQYLVPFIILVAVYIRICTRIRSLALVRAKNSQQAANQPPEVRIINVDSQVEPISAFPQTLHSCMETNQPPKTSVSIDAVSMVLSKSSNHRTSNALWKSGRKQSLRRPLQTERRKLRLKRQRRANILLTCISIVFAVSWLPLNVLNIFLDSKENPLEPQPASSDRLEYMSVRKVTLMYSGCLLCVLFSCCVNPLLYGYLNENYRKEFAEIFSSCCGCTNKSRSRESVSGRI
nr:Peptide (Neuropeptide F/Y-like) G protein-coupled receptor [Hymenolepis microstoma]